MKLLPSVPNASALVGGLELAQQAVDAINDLTHAVRLLAAEINGARIEYRQARTADVIRSMG